MITDIKSIDDAFDEKTRFYMRSAAHAINVIVCDVVPCWCGAKEGEYCMGAYGRRSASANGRHADRANAAAKWRKNNPKKWKALKDQAFRMIIKSRCP